jgi:shikimate dehydrogenase
MPITEIFRTKGETAFRDLESAVIRDLSLRGGAVIATGGGAVLRRENVDALKQNGTLVFLDRPLADLLPTDDRPLADDADKLKKLYAARYPIYTAAADVTVAVTGSPEDTMNAILECLQ